MSEHRELLGRSGGLFTRDSIYQTADGLEIDTSEHFEVVRRRVLFEDVSMVTYHSDRGFWFLMATGGIGALFTFMAMYIGSLGDQAWIAALPFLMFGLPAGAMFFIRLMFGRDVISVFGRRSKAVLRFTALRRARARAIYEEICAAVRRAQEAASAAEPAAEAPAMAEGVPMPPDVQV